MIRLYLLYPKLYLGFIALSVFDLVLTCMLLVSIPPAVELNPLAAAIFSKYGSIGLITYKLPLVLLIVGMMERVGRMRYQTGYRLAQAAVMITSIPIFWVLWQLLVTRRFG